MFKRESSTIDDNVLNEVRSILAEALGLGPRGAEFSVETALLGSIPELDSMAVVQVITALEEHYGFEVEDDEISAVTFETLGSLVSFVEDKLGQ